LAQKSPRAVQERTRRALVRRNFTNWGQQDMVDINAQNLPVRNTMQERGARSEGKLEGQEKTQCGKGSKWLVRSGSRTFRLMAGGSLSNSLSVVGIFMPGNGGLVASNDRRLYGVQ
jgi:hypothetical protein